ILYRRGDKIRVYEVCLFNVTPISLVIVDLYSFVETVAAGKSEAEVIEKIAIGRISILRAAAKTYQDVLIVSSRTQYEELLALLQSKQCATDLEDRRRFAAMAFDITAEYDTAIFDYFNTNEQLPVFRKSVSPARPLRYG